MLRLLLTLVLLALPWRGDLVDARSDGRHALTEWTAGADVEAPHASEKRAAGNSHAAVVTAEVDEEPHAAPNVEPRWALPPPWEDLAIEARLGTPGDLDSSAWEPARRDPWQQRARGPPKADRRA